MRDSDVRSAMRTRLQAEHACDPTTKIVEEMGVWSGSVRIDIAVINGELCGFELKSDRDTLDRLPLQAEIYSRVFDRVHLVVGERHFDKALGLVPEWWGIVVAKQVGASTELTDCRLAHLNPSPDPKLIAGLLWKEEALSVLDQCGLAKGWRSKSADAMHERLSKELPFATLTFQVRTRLKARSRWIMGSGPALPPRVD